MLSVQDTQIISKFGKDKKVKLESIKEGFDNKGSVKRWWDSKRFCRIYKLW